MGSNGIDYIDTCIVALLWGVTNPFLRKGTVEEDEKQRLLEEEEKQKQCQFLTDVGGDNHGKYCGNVAGDESLSTSPLDDREQGASTPLSYDIDLTYSYQSTCSQTTDGGNGEEESSDQNSTGSTSLSSHVKLSKSPYDYSLYQDQTKVPATSYTKGLYFQALSNCCHCSKGVLATLYKFHPRVLIKSFISSLVYELTKFTKPKIAIPFLLNQSSAVFYYRLIATSDLTNVSYCNALSIAVEGIVSYMLGERMSHPWRGFSGAFIIMLGVGICVMSKEIEHYFHWGADADADDQRQLILGIIGNGDGYNSIETLWGQNSEEHQNQNRVFAVSPFVCWYALCGILHWVLKIFGE